MTDHVREFLEVLRPTRNVTAAARSVGIARHTAYVHRADSVFSMAWDETEQEAQDGLESEAWRRGVEGVDKPVTHQGKITATYKEYSDRMLELLLRPTGLRSIGRGCRPRLAARRATRSRARSRTCWTRSRPG